MRSIRSQLFDLRPGEGSLVLESGLTLFGLIAAHTMLETTRDTLFLGHLAVGNLGLVYVLLAIASLFAAKANHGFLRAFGHRNSLIITLLHAAFGNIIFYLLPPSAPVVFALYIWSGLLSSILVVQFWMMVGQIYTVAQGKRLFGLISSGGVLGAVVGASLSLAVLDYANVQELLLVATGIFLATALYVTNHEVDRLPVTYSEESTASNQAGWHSGLGLFGDYPYLIRLSLLVGISTATVLATDYLFKAEAVRTISADELGRFFAQYYAVLNTSALIVQVFLSSSLILRAGVINASLILPTLLTIGGGLSLIFGGSLFSFVTKGADGSLRHSLHRISTELLWLPLPEYVRERAKGIVDTVVVRSSQALIATILIVMSAFQVDSSRHLAIMVCILGGIWLFLGSGLKKPYVDLFRSVINQRLIGRVEFDLRSVEVVVEALSDRNPLTAIAAIELLHDSGRTRLIPALILYHESNEVLLRALEVVPAKERDDWVPLAQRLLNHEQETIRVASLRALARHGHIQLIGHQLHDISPWVRAHAAFWIVSQNKNQPDLHDSIQMILEITGPSGREARRGLLEAIAQAGDKRWANLVLKLESSSEPEVALTAIRSMLHIRDPRFLPLLIRRLAIREERPMAKEAIVAFGDDALQSLVATLHDDTTSPRIVIHIPETIAGIRSKKALKILMECLENMDDGRVRYKILRALAYLTSRSSLRVPTRTIEQRIRAELGEYIRLTALHQSLVPELTWIPSGTSSSSGPNNEPPHAAAAQLLLGLLKDKREQAFIRIFYLLQIGFPDEDLRAIRLAAQSSDRKRRAQAQEFLDALTTQSQITEIRPLLRILIDDLSDEAFLSRALSYISYEPPPVPEQALQELLQSQDETLSRLTLYYILSSDQGGRHQETIEALHRRSSFQDLINLFPQLGLKSPSFS